MLNTYEKSCATILVLNLATKTLVLYFILNTHFDLIEFSLTESTLCFQIWWFFGFWNFFSIASY